VSHTKSMKTIRIAIWFLLLTVVVISTTAQSEGEISDKNWPNHPKIIAIRRIVDSANAQIGVARSRLSTESVRRVGLVGFESPATQRETSGGTSIIRRGKTHPGTIISTTTMQVICGLY
jgi:hypothetical protein